nr:hypothetical protein FJN17_32175 [Bradyrhizobium symbiodeficiens]
MSTGCGAGAACATDISSVRNRAVSRRRIGLCHGRCLIQRSFVQAREPFPFRWNRNGALDCYFDAVSSREPVSTSLENALSRGHGGKTSQTGGFNGRTSHPIYATSHPTHRALQGFPLRFSFKVFLEAAFHGDFRPC